MINQPDITFSFNPGKYNFWEIYECISEYYPIGIPKDESRFSSAYKGSKRLAEIIIDNTHNQDNFKERWENFDTVIGKQIDKEVTGATYGQSPSFNSYITISKHETDGLIRYKELHYFISFIGKFYTVIGNDSNELLIGKECFRSTNCLVVSPENVFKELFSTISDAIEKHFSGFRFVPYNICKQVITGLNTWDDVEIKNTVFDAVFGSSYFAIKQANVLGDEFYKADDWLIPGYIDSCNKWTIYPPGEMPGKP